MDELIQQLSDAVQSQNWLVVVVASVLAALAIVSIVLKALKKPVPILDTLLELGKGLVKILPAKKAPAPVDPSKDGVNAVVPVEDQTKK
jgi:nicotinamide riboside transporter PnuC